MTRIAEALAQIQIFHRAGRLAEAQQLCLRLLAADAANVEARCLLAETYHGLGQPHEAIEALEQVVRLAPDHVQAHNRLGILHAEQGHVAAAAGCFRKAIELRDDFAEAHSNLGAMCGRAGDLQGAAVCFERAVALQPDYAEALCNLGAVRGRIGDLDAAAICFRRAVELQPELAEAHNNLGAVLERQGRFDAAAASFRRAIALLPGYAEPHNGLGNVLEKQANFVAATASIRRALELKPDYAEAHNSLGSVLESQGQFEAATTCYRRAVELRPDYAEAHLNLALVLLLAEQFAEGWREYEWRWRRPGMPAEVVAQPRWAGEQLAGRTILLRSEQGLGDTIQFVRYASLVKRQGATVIVECQKSLARLVATCPGVDRVVAKGDPVGEFDFHVPLLTLPGMLGTTLQSIPGQVPYLTPDAELVERWKSELAGDGRLKVGIAWQGNPKFSKDRFRSVPLVHFAGIAHTRGIRLYSLQFGAGREQFADAAQDWPITDLGDRLGDFHNTAAIVRNLDLVITSDSAAAHLAGALGVPVWLALGFAPDFRWLLSREDSPWYPSMRLFRQAQPGDWQGVFERMRDVLETFTSVA